MALDETNKKRKEINPQRYRQSINKTNMSNVFRILAKIEYIKENNNVSVPSGVKKTQFTNVVLYRQWRARGARAK